MAGRANAFDALSDDLVLRVLQMLPWSDRRLTVQQVCRRWHNVTNAPHSPVWSSLHCYWTPDHPETTAHSAADHAFLRWLLPKLPAVYLLNLTWKGTGHDRQAIDLLFQRLGDTAAAPRLRKLFIICPGSWLQQPRGRLAALQTSLHELRLQVNGELNGSGGDDAVECSFGGLADSAAHLTRLMALLMDVGARLPPGFPVALTCLTSLRRLQLTNPASMVSGDDDDEAALSPLSMPTGISALSRLRLLSLDDIVVRLPDSISALQQLRALVMRNTMFCRNEDNEEDPESLGDHPWVVNLPDGVSTLTRLRLLEVSVARLPPWLPQLSQLTRLEAVGLSSVDEDIRAAFQAFPQEVDLVLQPCEDHPNWECHEYDGSRSENDEPFFDDDQFQWDDASDDGYYGGHVHFF